jgi:protein SCO1/2
MKRLLAFLLLVLFQASPLDAAAPFDPFGEATIDDRPGAQIPLDERFRDAQGQVTTLRRIADGRPLLLVPVLHDCPNICGVTLAGLLDAVDGQRHFRAGRDFTVVAFGIDPREGPADARADLQRLAEQHPGGTGRPVATTGDESAIRAVTDALGYRYAWDRRIGQYAHVSASAVLTPDGRLTRWLYGITPNPDDLAKAVADARAGRTGGFLDRLILLCYHYDPRTGTYSPMIERIVRYAGIATVLILGGLLVFLRRRWA